MSSTTARRALKLPLTLVDGELMVMDFGTFIDTHRDMPHIGMFEDDLHRGMCKPTRVHFKPSTSGGKGWIVRATDMKELELHPKHMFVTNEWFSEFVSQRLAETGALPLDGNGQMPTSLLRDPRDKKYLLKSFRNLVLHHLAKS